MTVFINNCKAKKYFLRKQRTNTNLFLSVCVCVRYRSLTLRLKKTASLHFYNTGNWLSDAYKLYIYAKFWFECILTQPIFSILEQLYLYVSEWHVWSLEVWSIYEKKKPLILRSYFYSWALHITAPHRPSLFSSYCFRMNSFSRNDTDENIILQDVAASQQG